MIKNYHMQQFIILYATKTSFPENTYVAVTYQGNLYVAKVLDHDENEVQLSFIEQSHAKTGITYLK